MLAVDHQKVKVVTSSIVVEIAISSVNLNNFSLSSLH